MSTESGEPWANVAQKYMAQRGYPLLKPRDVHKLDEIPCWYFVYDMPDGAVLELEVSWFGPGETLDGEWRTWVSTYQPPKEA